MWTAACAGYLPAVTSNPDLHKREPNAIRPDRRLPVLWLVSPRGGSRPWDEPFGGQAAGFLDELLKQIIPQAESSLPQPPAWRGVAGYSLAGLFALWALWQTDVFERAASASGSLWFPGFIDYARERTMTATPDAAYLSLGKKETKTPNRMMRHVLDDTRAMEELFIERDIPTTLELNPGNHFAQTDLRMARGIHWILTH